MDEAELIEKVREGDAAAGAQLISVLAPGMYRHAARLAQGRLSDTDVEIAAERAVEKAVASISGFDPARGEFNGWIYGILRRVVLDAVSARHGGDESVERLADAGQEIPDDRPSRSSPPPRIAPDLSAAVLALPVQDQAFLVLRYDTRLTWEEIADVIGGVTPDACRKRHSRLIGRLRKMLEEAPGESPHASVSTQTNRQSSPQES